MYLKFFFASLIGLCFPPCQLKYIILRLLGWKIGSGCRIGFSWINSAKIKLGKDVHIGHGNYIVVDSLFLSDKSYVGNLNLMAGPFFIILSKCAGVGNRNRVRRGKKGVVWGRSMLKLGEWSKITSEHIIDCTRSVVIGSYSTVAGSRSQLWTHGYFHAPTGLGRFRIDGTIRIGNNVYIGSSCIFNAGVKVSDAITVGAASCISRSLSKPGLYVSQPLRYIELGYEEASLRHPDIRVDGMVERVVNKHIPLNSK